MASTAPKTIGRGGAGNFRSTSDSKAAKTPPSPTISPTAVSQSTNKRGGRGGAGNLNTVAAETAISHSAAITIKAYKGDATPLGHGGRGGVGNWKIGAEEEGKQQGEGARRIKNEMHERARMEVDNRLMLPPKVYRAVGADNDGYEDETV